MSSSVAASSSVSEEELASWKVALSQDKESLESVTARSSQVDVDLKQLSEQIPDMELSLSKILVEVFFHSYRF